MKLHPRYIVDAQGRKLEAVLPIAEFERLLAALAATEKPAEVEVDTQAPLRQARARIAGLHAGKVLMSDDFDAELPDSFWLGEA